MKLRLFSFLFTASILTISCAPQIAQNSFSNNEEPVVSNESDIEKFQRELNELYLDPVKSPISKDQQKILKDKGGHRFFKTDQSLVITAAFDRSNIEKDIGFETSTDRIAVYDKYGTAYFRLGDKDYSVNIYQSHRTREMEEYKNHLFFPFYDLTNGQSTYGGGRYIDLTIPKGDKIVLDFNQAYHPYCAYSYGYSCPVPPQENFIDFEIKAGIKKFEEIESLKGH